MTVELSRRWVMLDVYGLRRRSRRGLSGWLGDTLSVRGECLLGVESPGGQRNLAAQLDGGKRSRSYEIRG